MPNQLVEEIDKKTYNPNLYYTSADPQTRSYRTKPKNHNANIHSQFRSVKRVNYSLADLEARLYSRPDESQQQKNTVSEHDSIVEGGTTKGYLDRFTQQQIIQSKRRFMELNTENYGDLSDLPTLLSSLTGMNEGKIELNSTSLSRGAVEASGSSRSSRVKFEIPRDVSELYDSTKPRKMQRKSTGRAAAVKKILSSKRQLHTYLDTLSEVDRSVILRNVYNKKYFRVLPLITVCSICGACRSISSCIRCGDKICSLKCYRIHNDTRCTRR